ncbi:hypothetical protein [Actinophytocola algeriensis]|uniref:Uncharacterized protein n=1 Tax=Actinophytocola algeriensis TaxID=1768010 RepID=A0A7W7VBM7_9PSEU|nr:hypothetical protein [Actinophytocola algeriensis]MBB4904169.1 hypothetical protein [Actinophytocola algeriensis]MBE1476974.1 hypothetical protein [Actinophytocola algeriensis]
MDNHARTLARQAEWTPQSGASRPVAFPPHPPLQSGGWYRGADVELPGPGRPPVGASSGMSARAALMLTLIFGLIGVLARSLDDGAFAVVVTVAVLAAPALLLRGRRRSD